MLNYAFGIGVRLAVLTNGLAWWLYLPMKGGRSFERRRFASIDFRGEDAGEAAAALNRFLNRDACVSGDTLREAEAEFDRQERDQQVRTVLPEAWSRVLGDQRLHDLFAQMVEEVSGHRPNPRTLGEFLRAMPGGQAAAPRDPAEPQPMNDEGASDGAQPTTTTAPPSVAGRTGRKAPVFWLDGTRYEVRSWGQMLRVVSDQLAEEVGPAFAERVAPVRGRTRRYFSEQATDLRRPVKMLNSALYVEANVSALQAEQITRRVLQALRGSDDGFRVGAPDGPDVSAPPSNPREDQLPGSSRSSPADLVVALLQDVGTPLHYREIERRLRESGKFEAGGRDPANTLLGRFFNDPRLHRTGRGTYALLASSEASPAPTPQERVTAPPAAPEKPDRATFAGRRLAAFWLDNDRVAVTTWPLMVRTLSEQLMADSGAAFTDRVATVRGRTRRYFSEQPDDLTHPRRLGDSNLYVEGNLGPDAAVRVARQTLTAVRGSDDGFRIELAE